MKSLLVAVTVGMLTLTAEAAHNKAVIRAIRNGAVEVSADHGKSWKKATVGTVVAAKYVLRTDGNATADIFLGENGPVVRLKEGTTLGFDTLDVGNAGIEKIINTQLDLRAGRIYGNVKKMAAASKYEVKTPVGVVGIRGTEYALGANGDLQVLSGTAVAVYVLNGPLDGGQAIVQAHEQISIVPGGRLELTKIPRLSEMQTEFAELIVGITTLPNGTMAAALATPNDPAACYVSAVTPTWFYLKGDPAITGTFDVVNFALTQIGPEPNPVEDLGQPGH